MTAAGPTGPTGAGWHAQQIAEFLAAVSVYENEPAALDGAVERAAEAMEAEVAAWYRASTLDEEKAIARRLNKAALDNALYAPLGV